ncbi:MAG TPA: ABC transporter permease [Xanthobacteraceae bacterium]|nr:ABC transporter permease [Xanthobacteraceae bacterium]
MTDQATDPYLDEEQPDAVGPLRRYQPTPIVPGATVTGAALVAVVAIMTFLASLTIGSVSAVRGLASSWTADISRETTIQIKPADGLDIEAALAAAVDTARRAAGVAAARALDPAETAALLEPWLGAGLDIANLPVPRLVVVTLSPAAGPADIAGLRTALAGRVPAATLDDHRQWSDRLTSTARQVVAVGFAVLALVGAATILSVVFATRAAVAAGQSVVEVLHLVGARDSLIAGEFQRHFLAVGLKGGAIGGGAAVLMFFVLATLPAWLRGGAPADPAATLIGAMTLDLRGYGGIFGVSVLVVLVTAATSRLTVYRTLRRLR